MTMGLRHRLATRFPNWPVHHVSSVTTRPSILSTIFIQEDPPPPPKAASRPTWTRRDLLLGLALLAFWRTISLVPHEWLAGAPEWLRLGIGGLAPQLTLLAFPLILAWRRRPGPFRWPAFERLIVEGALAIPVVMALLALLIVAGLILRTLAPQTTLTPEVLQNAAMSRNYSFLIAISALATLVAPLCEECFFRGFLYRALRARMPKLLAALSASFLFAALHTFGALHAIAVFFLGLILTAVYEWRKTLLAPIFVHAGNNLIAVLGLFALTAITATTPVLGVVGRDHPDGYQVDQVLPASGAAVAGIIAGDIITDVDGEPVPGFARLLVKLHNYKAGDRVTVGINRDGEHLIVSVTLGGRPPAE
jgi:membrane protease YdiL (CAAX protease family)